MSYAERVWQVFILLLEKEGGNAAHFIDSSMELAVYAVKRHRELTEKEIPEAILIVRGATPGEGEPSSG